MTAAVIIAGVFFGFGSLVGWIARAIMAGPDIAELYRLRGDVARITAHTMARREARAAASRKGWAQRRKGRDVLAGWDGQGRVPAQEFKAGGDGQMEGWA